jgi:hypothetical protein
MIQQFTDRGLMMETSTSFTPMNRRRLLKSLASIAITACLVAGNRADAGETLRDDPASGKNLRVGQSWRYDDGLKITFLAVRDDNRCPIEARCLCEGDAKVVLLVKTVNQAPKKVVLHTSRKPRLVFIPAFPPGTIGIPKTYGISVGSLTPDPHIGKKIHQSDYRLNLSIAVAL